MHRLRRWHIFLLTLIWFWPFSTRLKAQEPTLQTQFWGIDEGLSNRDVQCIHQDRLGFMWFGTKYGLNRFDGHDFRWFTNEKNGLQSNEINHILEDTQGRMWLVETGVFTDHAIRSLDLFDPFSHQVNRFERQFPSAPFAPKEVICFGQNQSGHLAFLTTKQLHLYTDHFESFPIELGEFKSAWLKWADDGRIWVCVLRSDNASMLLALDAKGKTLYQFLHPAHGIHIYNLDRAGNCNYTVRTTETTSEYYRIDASGKQTKDDKASTDFNQKGFSQADPIKRIEKREGYQWLISSTGTVRLSSEASGVVQLLYEQYPNLWKSTDLFFDKNHAVWVSTQFGIYRFELRKPVFKTLLMDMQAKGYTQDFACRGMSVDNLGQLWVSVENRDELWSVDLASKSAVKIASNPTPPGLMQNKAGEILHFQKKAITATNPVTKRARTYQEFDWQPYNWMLHEDKYGKIWFDDYTGVKLGFIENGKVTTQTNWTAPSGQLFCYQILEEKSDTAWLVTSSGVFALNLHTGQILQRYWKGGTGKLLLPFDNVNHALQNVDGSFWLATAGTGLVHWSPSAGVIERFTRADGLPNNTIYAVYRDKRGYFWLPTDDGIAKFNPTTKKVRSYGPKDGLSDREFNRISHCQDEKGNLYFGSLNGVTTFHPDDLLGDTTQTQPPMVITGFQQFDGSQEKLLDRFTELRQTNIITVEPDDRYFLLDFALLTYEDEKNVQYAFKVEGVDNDWTYQSENKLRLTRLPYGTHTLHIRGQASNGQWSEKELAIKMIVLKPFYLQAWFLLALVIGILAGFYIYNQWHVRVLKARHDELEQEVEVRTRQISSDKKIIEHQAEELKSLEQLKSRFFANVSHELRTPLTLLLGPVNSLLKRKEKEDNEETKLLQFAQRNAQQLQKLINEILDLSKLEHNKMELAEEPVPFYAYLKEQMAQFHSAALSNELNFILKFNADKSLQILLDKGKFEKIVHNFLSNALKFTPKGGKITLTVEEKDDKLQLSVADTGRGIHPDDLPHIFDRFYQSKQKDTPTEGGTGIGLALVKELAELLGGEVWVRSAAGEGSAFYFKFPKKIVAPSATSTVQDWVEEEPVPNLRDAIPIEKAEVEVIPALSRPKLLPKESGTKATLLIVEDNPDLREYLQILLSDYNVVTAENGQAALDILTERDRQPSTVSRQPDLIISDLMMPVMDGFQFLEKLKSDDRWRHLPVIMLTAKVNVQAKLQALRIGVDDYLTKPFEEEELKARIENLLRNYQERMAYFSANGDADASSDETVVATKPVIAEVDNEWLKEVEAVFSKILSDRNFNLEWVASEMSLSTRQFSRRLQKLVGLSPNHYLQEIRLQQAKDFLLNGKFATIKETGYAVGFRDTPYFSALFQERFGVLPSAYLRS